MRFFFGSAIMLDWLSQKMREYLAHAATARALADAANDAQAKKDYSEIARPRPRSELQVGKMVCWGPVAGLLRGSRFALLGSIKGRLKSAQARSNSRRRSAAASELALGPILDHTKFRESSRLGRRTEEF
jgi:hypothetical protein